jgi:hypothetical protein
MSSGYTVNGTDFDDLFLPRIIGAATGNSGYKVGTQDLSDRYEASRSVGDRSTTTTNFKISSGADINTLYMAKRTAVIPRKTSIDEGTSVTFDVAVGVAAGTTLYWSLSRSDLSPNSGSFVVQSSGAHSFVVTANNDVTTEGTTSFTASIRRNSISGTIIATSADVTINDTSVKPTYPDTLAFELRQYSGDCFQLYVSGSNSKTYSVYCTNSANNGGLPKYRGFTFNPTSSPGTPRVNIINQGWGGNRFNIQTISLLNGAGGTVKTWDIHKTFYTGSNIDGITSGVFTITNLGHVDLHENATYNLSSNTYSYNLAIAKFTIGVN